MFRKKCLGINLFLILFFVVSFAFATTNNDIEERISKNEDPTQILKVWCSKYFMDEEWERQKEWVVVK